MPKILHEETYLTMDLKSLIGKNTDNDGVDKKPQGQDTANTGKSDGSSTEAGKGGESGNVDGTKITDWGKELDRRIAENDALDPEAQEDEDEIEDRFWAEYFTTVYGQNIGNRLLNVGDLLRSDISNKNWGGFSKVNPVVSFIGTKYVKENLIATGLLNVNTYDAIHDTIEQKLVHDSEFKNGSKNNYNIIYCKDLYTRSSDEMLEYLKIQKAHLGKYSTYTVEVQDLNKRIFLQLSKNTESDTNKRALNQLKVEYDRLPSMRDQGVKLNSVNFAKQLCEYGYKHMKMAAPQGKNQQGKTSGGSVSGGVGGEAVYGNDGSSGSGGGASLEKLNELVERADSLGEVFALLQYASMVSNSTAVQKVLGNTKFNSLDAAKISAGTRSMAPYTKGLRLSAQEATALASMLSGKRVKKEKKPGTKVTDTTNKAAATGQAAQAAEQAAATQDPK